MAVREQQHVTVEAAKTRDKAIGASAYRIERFATGTAIAEEKPARPLLADVCRALALVLAVIPLDQIAIDLGIRTEAGQVAGALRALQRAGQHPGEVTALQ